MSISSLIDRINEEYRPENTYTKCWAKDLSKYSPEKINPNELKWLLKFLGNDFIFKSYSSQKKEALLKLINNIEEKVPIISEAGVPLSGLHRLYISSEIAKVLLNRSRSVLNILSSIVVYSDLKLRKNFNEAGLLLSTGFKSSSIVFTHLVHALEILEQNTPHSFIGKDEKKIKSLINEFKYWSLQLTEDLSEKKKKSFLSFLKGGTDSFQKLFLSKQNAVHLMGEIHIYKEEKEQIHALLLKLVHKGDAIFMESEASIHISLPSHFVSQSSKNSNLIIHELAHAIDFEYAGMDGVPSTDLTDNAGIVRKWAELFEEALNGEFTFLNPYGLTNCYEFFAVTTEHYFKEPSIIKASSLKLYQALEEVYGPEQGDVPKWSRWKLTKLLCFSKISSFRL